MDAVSARAEAYARASEREIETPCFNRHLEAAIAKGNLQFVADLPVEEAAVARIRGFVLHSMFNSDDLDSSHKKGDRLDWQTYKVFFDK